YIFGKPLIKLKLRVGFLLVKKNKKSYQIKAQDKKIQIFLKPAISRLNRHTNIANTFIAPNQSIPTLVSRKNEEKKRHASTEDKINNQEMKDKNPKVAEEYSKLNKETQTDINRRRPSTHEQKSKQQVTSCVASELLRRKL